MLSDHPLFKLRNKMRLNFFLRFQYEEYKNKICGKGCTVDSMKWFFQRIQESEQSIDVTLNGSAFCHKIVWYWDIIHWINSLADMNFNSLFSSYPMNTGEIRQASNVNYFLENRLRWVINRFSNSNC